MLEAAGIAFDVRPAEIDETALRQRLVEDEPAVTPATIAEQLAIAKAHDISRQHRDAWVIGSDQVLNLSSRILTKPCNATGVRETLVALSGRTHELHAAVALARDGDVLWSTCETACLHMRTLSAAFIEHYIASAGPDILHCVGAYQIEGRGIQLFDRIVGDHFTILGMPLLPLLAELRHRGVIDA